MVFNDYVVPYNPYLLAKYRSHINVEVVSKVEVVKYIFKYVFKGFDLALVQFMQNFDANNDQQRDGDTNAEVNGAVVAPAGIGGNAEQYERANERIAAELSRNNITPGPGEKVTAYDEGIISEIFRQMTACEAAWIILGFPMAGSSHIVKKLRVHEPGKQPVLFFKGREAEAVQRVEEGRVKSPFMAWLETNVRDVGARQHTYIEFARLYKLSKSPTRWAPYKRQPQRLVTYIAPVNPRYVEQFAIRELVKARPGACSFEELRTVDDELQDTFQEAAALLGLMNSDREFVAALDEAVHVEIRSSEIRRLFVSILIYGGAKQPLELWMRFRMDMLDRRYRDVRDVRTRQKGEAAALYHINELLSHHGSSVSAFELPEPNMLLLGDQDMRDALDPPRAMMNLRSSTLKDRLNSEQRKVFDKVVRSVENGRGDCYFLQASGGCGKTFIYRALYEYLTAKEFSVINVASTGIAATLLEKGSTAHRRFFLPINLGENGKSKMDMSSKGAEKLKECHLIIFDEATMADRFVLNAIDNLLKDVCEEWRPFGGKVVLLGGDWKQLLPVVTGKSSASAIDYTLLYSPQWRHFEMLHLRRNMRAKDDASFAEFLEETGRGLYLGKECSYVQIKQPGIMCKDEGEVIHELFGHGKAKDEDYIYNSCLLVTRNKEALRINEKVMNLYLPGSHREYVSIDTPVEGAGVQLPPEYFHTLMESGMPPHRLRLKVGMMVILLRNIRVHEGLCNGTRLLVTEMHEHFIVAKMLDSKYKGREVTIGKAKLSTADSEENSRRPKYERFQLPLRQAFCLTINKAQGQSFRRVGIILHNNPFAHGQLYVALSRAHSWGELKIYSHAMVEGVLGPVLVNNVNRNVLAVIKEPEPVPADEEFWVPQPPSLQTTSQQPGSVPPPAPGSVAPQASTHSQSPLRALLSQPARITEMAALLLPRRKQPPAADQVIPLHSLLPAPEQGSAAAPLVRAPSRPAPPPPPPRPSAPPVSRASYLVEQQPESTANIFAGEWLALPNRGTDCFLISAVHVMRKMTAFRIRLEAAEPALTAASDQPEHRVLLELLSLLRATREGSVTRLRSLLRRAFREDENFLKTQQDASEVLFRLLGMSPLDQIMRDDLAVGYEERVRCLPRPGCDWATTSSENKMMHAIGITAANQVVNLEEELSSAWGRREQPGSRHCTRCCCRRHGVEEHDQVKECDGSEAPFEQERRFVWQPTGRYLIISVAILSQHGKLPWILAGQLFGIRLFGVRWNVAAMIEHRDDGFSTERASAGHYVTWIQFGALWLLVDDAKPVRVYGRFEREYAPTPPQLSHLGSYMKDIVAIVLQRS